MHEMTKWYDQYYLEYGKYPPVVFFDHKLCWWLKEAIKRWRNTDKCINAEEAFGLSDSSSLEAHKCSCGGSGGTYPNCTICGKPKPKESSPEPCKHGSWGFYPNHRVCGKCQHIELTIMPKEDKKQPLPTSWDCCNYWTFGNYCGSQCRRPYEHCRECSCDKYRPLKSRRRGR